MTNKHKGGRGLKAETPYERLSFTMPPHLKAYLDAQAEGAGISRSEMLARILEDHQAQKQQPKPAAIPEGESTTPPLRGTSTATAEVSAKKAIKERDVIALPDNVEISVALIEKSVRGKLRWDKERYAAAEDFLSDGGIISRKGTNYINSKGKNISWRTVKSLMKFGILRSC